tara:strand:+ start:110 stop:616 length:507 start_codon:yes stop_codon:yes gene_type:complete
MIRDKIILIAKKHQIWVEIVMTFGTSKQIAEDIVQEMYIKILIQLEKGKLDLTFNDDLTEINYFYIFKTLKTLFIDLKRKQKKIKIIHLDAHLEMYGDTYYAYNDVDYAESYEKVTDELLKMEWYDRRVFEIINGGESVAEFSRRSKINYYALYFTYKKVKDKLKKLI